MYSPSPHASAPPAASEWRPLLVIPGPPAPDSAIPVRQYGREVFDSSCLACRRSGFDDCAGCGVAEEG